MAKGIRERSGLFVAERVALLPVCLCLCAAASVTGCAPAGTRVVYDLAARTGIAERWSRHPVILFGTPSAEPHLVDGFHREAAGGSAEAFVWAREAATLSLTWGQVQARAAVLDVAPFAAVKGQALRVTLNDREVDAFALNDGRHRYRVKLPAEAQRTGENRLRLSFARAASPAELDPGSGDRRSLAAAVYSLVVGGAGDAALDDLLRRDAPRPFSVGIEDGVPWLAQVGPSVVRFAFRLPRRAALRFTPVLHPAARAAAAQASFRVTLERAAVREVELWSRVVRAHDATAEEVALELPGRAGEIVRLGLHLGGEGEARFAWGLWRAPRLLGSQAPPSFEPTPLPPEAERRGEALRRAVDGANVLLLILDAARARQFGAYGYPRATTPQLDRIAAEGVLFERAFTPAAYTLGAMSSVWTSQYPHLHHSAVSFSSRLPTEALTLAEVVSAQGIACAGFVANAMAGRGFGLDRGFGEFHEVFRQGSEADVLRRAVEPWLEAKRGQRFFAYVHFREPHYPFDPPPPFDTRFGPDGPIPKARRRDERWIPDVNQGRRVLEAGELEHLVRLYDGNLAFADQEVGRLRQALEASGLWEKTVVIVAADHGEALREHGFIGHNVQLYDHTIQIPLIIRGPGLPAGLRVATLVDLLDVAPTIADVLGVRGKGGSDREFRGRSLLPVVAGAPGKQAILSRTVWDRPVYSIRDEAFKLIYDTRTGAEQLYDLSADPQETHDLAAAEPLRAAFYRQALHHWLREVSPRAGSEQRAQPTPEQCENLRALGYVDVAGCP